MNSTLFTPNPAQMGVMLNLSKLIFNIWPRGQGKSNAIADIIDTVVHAMPRGTTTFLGRTYVDLNMNILPEVIKGLEQRKYYKGIHYFLSKCPPESVRFPGPLSPVKEYDKVMHWYTGHIIIFASQDRDGANRGGSIDYLIVDEVLNIKKEQLDKEIIPKLRGNKEYFGHLKIHHGIFACSSKPIGSGGEWVYKHAEYYKEDKIYLNSLVRELTDLDIEFIDNDNPNARRLLWKDIVAIQKDLVFYQHKDTYYNECRVWNNIKNLGFNYIKAQRRIMSTSIFRVEILNDYFNILDNAFYPTFNEAIHVTRENYNYNIVDLSPLQPKPEWYNDYSTDLPMIIGQDYGVNVNFLLAAQRRGSKINILHEFIVKAPKWTRDVVVAFCEFYKNHKNKYIYYHYDHTGNNRNANAKPLSDECVDILSQHGWTVQRCTIGAAYDPDAKYHLAHSIFSEQIDNHLVVRINGNTCPNLIKSILLSPVKKTIKGIAKDKSSEDIKRNPDSQESATHGSDTLDFILCGETIRDPVFATSSIEYLMPRS